ncbi:ComEA family DNA-binding protein [Paenibacillus sp. TRM 82003]|nr:ComEA family DNA-binding protein [Paenibacillus sp. TRM 82003]
MNTQHRNIGFAALAAVLAAAAFFFSHDRPETPSWRDVNEEAKAWLASVQAEEADEPAAVAHAPADGAANRAADIGAARAADGAAGQAAEGAAGRAADGAAGRAADGAAGRVADGAAGQAAEGAAGRAAEGAAGRAAEGIANRAEEMPSEAIPAPAPSEKDASPPAAVDAPPGLLDLNAATAEQLDALPGIGKAKAQAIVAYREANGPFHSVEQIQDVKGIGPAIFENIRESIAVRP